MKTNRTYLQPPAESRLGSRRSAEAQRAIDLLPARRTALISAAVTGQIDVRPGAPVSQPA